MASVAVNASATAPGTVTLKDGTGVVLTPKKLKIQLSPNAKEPVQAIIKLGSTTLGTMTILRGQAEELPLTGNIAGSNGDDFEAVVDGAKDFTAPIYFSGEVDSV